MKTECKHKWVKTPSGYICQRCSAIVLDRDVIPALGTILEDSDLQDEISEEKDQPK
jgi:hypothetical protein